MSFWKNNLFPQFAASILIRSFQSIILLFFCISLGVLWFKCCRFSADYVKTMDQFKILRVNGELPLDVNV